MAGSIKAIGIGKTTLRYKPLYPADLLKFETLPSMRTVDDGRAQIANIIHQQDDRLLVVVGPSSVRDPRSALLYATLLYQASLQFDSDLRIVMRCYVDKPRAASGWSGLLNDPLLDGSFEINQGLRLARQLFVDITQMGLPVATELLGALSQLYFTDLVSVNLMETRMAESPLHRELASSVQFPVGFITKSAGELGPAVDAMAVASSEHHYISATPEGRAAIAWTPGNDDCFVILQGDLPNGACGEHLISSTIDKLLHAQKSPVAVVDVSQEGHSLKRQLGAIRELCTQVSAGEQGIVGVILGSCLEKIDLEVPQSSSCEMDAGDCMDWKATMSALEDLATATRKRREATCAMS
ncbi:hypothetical protein OPT61_g5365 [Boeremia exigua]|uniref:Uncharacterized protein n=1 Tax=Boeremia exigua TaxID=749465 RepID=A0ACC2IAQ6_9PLEO|nr:hypothetical protein OPT61_g5365 [Boeremia exigua]